MIIQLQVRSFIIVQKLLIDGAKMMSVCDDLQRPHAPPVWGWGWGRVPSRHQCPTSSHPLFTVRLNEKVTGGAEAA